MLKDWKVLFEHKAYLLSFIGLFLLTLGTLKLCSIWLLLNEARTHGFQLNDFILNAIPAQDYSLPIFIVNWFGIFLGIIISMRTPKRAMTLFIAVIIIILLRSITMYFIPLLPPEGIIPLRDSFLECSFYSEKILLKDLFFSGHTASLALLFFFVDIKLAKYIIGICMVTVATLLLLQHVHYTIDVVAAPLFSYFAIVSSHKLMALYCKKMKAFNKLNIVLT